MSSLLDRDIAGLFCIGFHGTAPSLEVLDLIRRGVHGVILLGRNVAEAEQVAQLVGDLKRAAGDRRLLVSIDQEGGRVARLRAAHGFTELPPMQALGKTGDADLARQVGALLGRELRAVGIDLDYAPCVDVNTNPANPVIGDRALSGNPAQVAWLGAALAQGLQSQGVAACAKHFPGHGDTSQDSHVDLPRLPHSLERLRRVELPPFAALARAGVASVMTAHVVFEALDPDRPATLSAPVLRLLREELGFDGCCISDDLEMKAVAEHFPLEEIAPGASRPAWTRSSSATRPRSSTGPSTSSAGRSRTAGSRASGSTRRAPASSGCSPVQARRPIRGWSTSGSARASTWPWPRASLRRPRAASRPPSPRARLKAAPARDRAQGNPGMTRDPASRRTRGATVVCAAPRGRDPR